MPVAPPIRRPLPLIAVVGPALAILFAALFACAALAVPRGLLSQPTARTIIDVSMIGGLVGALLSIPGALATRPGTHRRGFLLTIVGILVGVACFVLGRA